MEDILGKRYVLVSTENFDEYLKFTGIGYISRKAALALKPEQCLTRNEDGSYSFSFVSALVSSSITFRLGEEFEETKPDGVKVKSVITVEGNKMFHTQTEENGRVLKHIREFTPDQMIVMTTADGFDKTAVRYYELVKELNVAQ